VFLVSIEYIRYIGL